MKKGDITLFVIAEIGVNHDGSVERALELVRAAANAGADAVKLQIFSADRLMHRASRFAGYQKSAVNDATAIDMLRRYELPVEAVGEIVAEIRRLNMDPLATPFSLEDVEQIEALDLPAIKIASPDVVNWPLLRRAAATGRPLLVSTGAATMQEIERTVGWLDEWKATFVLLHCVSSYPTPADMAHLGWIGELAERFDVPVGYSDHTTEALAGALAVMAGATIVEKHLTYDRAASGPDHAASADPEQFAQYVNAIRVADRMRGEGGRRVLEIERDVRTVSRQSLVAARDLVAGQVLCETDLLVQRPGTGMPAAAMPQVLGRRLRQAVRAGEMLDWPVIADAA